MCRGNIGKKEQFLCLKQRLKEWRMGKMKMVVWNVHQRCESGGISTVTAMSGWKSNWVKETGRFSGTKVVLLKWYVKRHKNKWYKQLEIKNNNILSVHFLDFIPFYRIYAVPNGARTVTNKLPLSGCSNNVWQLLDSISDCFTHQWYHMRRISAFYYCTARHKHISTSLYTDTTTTCTSLQDSKLMEPNL